MISTKAHNEKPLKQIFTDLNYAWQLLQAQVKLQTSQAQAISGEDISYLLQLYMRGVEKMNTLIDIRESFFKNKVTSLMSRPLVMRILNKPMTKKSQPAVALCTSPNSIKEKKQNRQDIPQTPSPKKLIDTKKQLQLKQKKQSLEMRLAYSAQQNNPDALKKLLAEHSHKQTLLTQKIQKIVDSHQQQLKKRIMARKLKSLTIKSKYTQDNSELNENYKKQIDNQIGYIEENSSKVIIKQKINSQEKKQMSEQQKMRGNSQKTKKIKERQEQIYKDKPNQRSQSQDSKKNKLLADKSEDGNKQMDQMKQTIFRKLSMDQIKNIAFKQNFIQLAIQMSKKYKDKNLQQQIKQKQQTFTNSTEQKQ